MAKGVPGRASRGPAVPVVPTGRGCGALSEPLESGPRRCPSPRPGLCPGDDRTEWGSDPGPHPPAGPWEAQDPQEWVPRPPVLPGLLGLPGVRLLHPGPGCEGLWVPGPWETREVRGTAVSLAAPTPLNLPREPPLCQVAPQEDSLACGVTGDPTLCEATSLPRTPLPQLSLGAAGQGRHGGWCRSRALCPG